MAHKFPPFQLVAAGMAAERGYRRLFEGLSFDLAPGDLLELRGANGVGKTTLLRMAAGLTRPAAGDVLIEAVGGADAERADAGRWAHYVGHLDAVKAGETALAQLRFWARFFGRPASAAEAALDKVDLSRRSDVPGRGLSAGQKRRLALARLWMAERPIWLLDEPLASLDAPGVALTLGLIGEHRAAGGAVIAAVHGDALPDARSLDLADYRPTLASVV